LADIEGSVENLRWAALSAEAAAALDPYSLEHPKRLMNLYERLGDGENARKWAGTALKLDEQTKYDRAVRGLSKTQREEAERLAGKP
jgi:hypothetical protein